MQQDVADFVRKCDSCKRYGNIQQVLGEKMTAITSPRTFAQWGIDIMGPLPQGKKQVKFLLFAIDYFTKWVEVETLATITKAKVRNFVWKNIVCRFRIPQTIISDNVVSLTARDSGHSAQALALKRNIPPQDIPKPMDKLRTTARTPTGETPFNLAYGTEAVIPIEIGLTSLRKEFFDEHNNDNQLKLNLDCLDEVRDQDFQRMAKYP
ncbi:uncharacterized protein LOC142628535 [Castanea sativa]|uniref:uncharacterized protein LOC142628535 n=1 Tax=Castanea sativa TaxID=21020 RepID=UPI003F653678